MIYFVFIGDQGQDWNEANVQVSSTLSGPERTILFRGTRGNGWGSDIALDDIVIKQGQCPTIP